MKNQPPQTKASGQTQVITGSAACAFQNTTAPPVIPMEEAPFRLMPGDIVFVRKTGPDPIGWFIRKQQGDFNWNHVCLVGRDGQSIWTTGAKSLVFYGSVSAQTYLKGKQYVIGRLSCLATHQLENILLAAESLNGNLYPSWSLLQLIGKGFSGNSIPKLGRHINERPAHFFCSQAVAWCVNKANGLSKPWRDGLILNTKAQKEDCTAYTPETIYYHQGLTLFQPNPAINNTFHHESNTDSSAVV